MTELSPERCAELHNQLVRRISERLPNSTTDRSLLERFLEVAPDLAGEPNATDSPVCHFFSLVDTLNPNDETRGTVPLTPTVLQPDPRRFFSENVTDDDPENIICLYRAVDHDRYDHGLYFNHKSGLAHWHYFPGAFAPADKWQPLENVLQRWLAQWERGKYYWNQDFEEPKLRPWVNGDVADSIAAWEALLETIEARIPEPSRPTDGRLEPLPSDLLEQYHVAPLAKAFLSRARRPRFQFIAPGVVSFTPATFEELYSFEPPTATRRAFGGPDAEPDEEVAPTLILPLASLRRVPDSPEGNSTFNADWGYGKLTVQRAAGLYTDAIAQCADGVRFVDASGWTEAFQLPGSAPWGPGRNVKMAEVFKRWAKLVTEGTWEVNENGVATGREWFWENRSSSDTQMRWDHEEIIPVED